MASEKRLIDANKADVENISCYYGSNCYIEDVQSWLDEQPTVDAVEVVRCKNCEHTREKSRHEKALYAEDTCVCIRPDVFGDPENQIVWNDHFCSYGERRSDV